MKYAVIILLAFGLSAAAQTDPKAKALLDQSIEKMQEMDAMKIDFTYSLENTSAGVSESHKGSALVMGDMFSVELMGYHQISDSKTLWTVSPDDEEVMISSMDDLEGSMTPSSMLNLYESGMKVGMGEIRTVNGAKVQSVVLVPSTSADKPYHRIEVGIHPETYTLAYAYEYGKNGTTTGYEIQDIEEKQGLTAKNFSIKAFPAYKNFDSIDLR